MQEQRVTQEEAISKAWVDSVENRASQSKQVMQVEVVDGTSKVEIPDELIQNSVPLWKDFVYDIFLEKSPHVAKIHVIVLAVGEQDGSD